MGAFFFFSFHFFVILKLTAEQFPGNNGYHQNERLVLVLVYMHALTYGIYFQARFRHWMAALVSNRQQYSDQHSHTIDA